MLKGQNAFSLHPRFFMIRSTSASSNKNFKLNVILLFALLWINSKLFSNRVSENSHCL